MKISEISWKADWRRALHSKTLKLFCALLVPVILVTVLVQASFSRLMLDTLTEMNSTFAANAKTNTETINSILLNYALSIYYSNEVKTLRSEAAPENIEVIQGVRAMNNLTAVYSFIESVYIYNGAERYIYSTSDVRGTNDTVDRFGDRSAAEIFQHPEQVPKLSPFFRNTEYGSPRGNKSVYSYLIVSGNQNSAMMINLSADWLNELILGNDAHSCLLDGEGKILSSQMEVGEAERTAVTKLLGSRETDNGYFFYSFPGSPRRVCFFSDMEPVGWRYLRLMNYDDCIGGQRKVQRIAYLFVLAVLIAACLLALILLLRVVFPFRRLNTVMAGAGLAPQGNSRIEEMTEKLNRLISLSNRAEHIESAFNDMLRNETLYNVLTGAVEPEEVLKHYALKVNLYQPVMLFYLNGVNIERYIRSLPSGVQRMEGINVSGRHSVLLIQSEGAPSSREIAEALLSSRPAGFVIYGEVTTHPDQLQHAYRHLVRMYTRRCFYHGLRLLDTETLSRLTDDVQDLLAASHRLISALKNGNSTGAREQIQAVLDLLSDKKYHTAIAHLISIYRSMLLLRDELCPGDGVAVQQKVAAFEALLNDADSLDEVRAAMDDLSHEIVSAARQAKAIQHETLIQQVMEYIQASYADPNLNSQMLADHFQISVAYLGRIFRKENNQSLAAYITGQRMEKACELLRTTDESIKTISSAVGLENSQYFYVQFKQHTGMTPSEYRALSASDR